jgi:hypothetical protein
MGAFVIMIVINDYNAAPPQAVKGEYSHPLEEM